MIINCIYSKSKYYITDGFDNSKRKSKKSHIKWFYKYGNTIDWE